MNDWIKSNEELPPCDGNYQVANNIDLLNRSWGTAFYDGYGFKNGAVYVDPEYWRPVKFPIKKYGKVKKDD